MKLILPAIITSLFFFVFVGQVLAVEDPLAVPNNKFGVHVIDENDLSAAADLVNSTGGEWGYVTIVIRKDERDTGRWQKVFDEMRRLKIIPIIRIATLNKDGVWEKPLKEDAQDWALFLNSLNWPIKNRYVVLFNEPNHAKEWGGRISPTDYARVARSYWEELKDKSSDFFVLPAGVDGAASDSRSTMDEAVFLRQMLEEDPEIFTIFDGWTSHSYPNPGFSGSPSDTGRRSIRGFDWELSYLSELGAEVELPVFITETGWVRRNGYDEKLSENYDQAYKEAWNDSRVVAVTPFVLSYIGKPFEQFSWRNNESGEFYDHYYAVVELEKIMGEPVQIHDYEVDENLIPDQLVSNSVYEFGIKLKNTGQSIWVGDTFEIRISGDLVKDGEQIAAIDGIEPGQILDLALPLVTKSQSGEVLLDIGLTRNKQPFGPEITQKVEVIAPPSLLVFSKLWFIQADNSNNYTLSVYEGDIKVLEFTNFLIKDSLGMIPELYDVVPGRDYRFSLSRPFYLTATKFHNLSARENRVDFGRLLPFDLNGDSNISLGDLVSHFKNPVGTYYAIFSI